MIQQKARYYPDIKDPMGNPKIVPIETKVNFRELTNPSPKPDYKGTDKYGDWILIDFIHGDDTFIEYKVCEVKDQYGRPAHQARSKEITEKEWDQTEAVNRLDSTKKIHSNVNADVLISKKLKLTSSEQIQQICSTVKKKWLKTMQFLF